MKYDMGDRSMRIMFPPVAECRLMIVLCMVGMLLTCTPCLAQADDSNGTWLRSQVSAASSGATIAVPAGIYTLSSPIVIHQSLTILGADQASTFIQSAASAGAAGNQLLRIVPSSDATITLSNLTIRYARNPNDPATSYAYQGGAIIFAPYTSTNSVLNVNSCTISDSSSTYGDGGGISASNGQLNISNSLISGNTATDGCGGGLFVGTNARLTITDSTILGNQATGTIGHGGGICLLGPITRSTSTISNTTITGNSALYDGGGIYSTAPLSLSSITYADNSASRYANDLWNNSGVYSLTNAAPAVSLNPATASYTEGDAAKAVNPLLTIADNDNMYLASATVTLVSSPDALAENLTVDVSGTSIVSSVTRGANNSSITVSLSQIDRRDNYQAVLRTLKYSNSSENPTSSVRSISYMVNDGNANSSTQYLSLSVSQVNDTPTVSFIQPTYTATEQIDLTLHNTGITIADNDAASASVTSALSITEGILTATAGSSGVLIGNSGTGTITINGTIPQTNAFLAGSGGATLLYRNISDSPSGNVTLTVQVNDNGNSGGAAQTGSTERTISVIAVNDQPSLAINTGFSVALNTEATAITPSHLLLSDPDNPAANTLSYILTATPARGSLKKNATTLEVGSSFTQADIQGGSITFTPSGTESGESSFSFTYSDGIIPVPSGPATFAITIRPLPTLAVSIIGNGSVTSQNTKGDNYTCPADSCPPVPFSEGDTVTLTATAGSHFGFTEWSGDIAGSTTPYSFVITSDKSVAATFSADPATVRIDGSHNPYYTFTDAIDALAQDGAILSQASAEFVETIIVASGLSIRIRGGFTDTDFSDLNQTGFSTISGLLKIQAGKLTVERLKIKP